jgi:hypothetical protein
MAVPFLVKMLSEVSRLGYSPTAANGMVTTILPLFRAEIGKE